MAITMATIGRLIKNFDMVSCSLPPTLPPRRAWELTGIPSFANWGAAAANLLHLQDAFDHDLLARLQTFGDDPIRADPLAHLDRAKHGFVFGRDHDDLILRLHFDDGRLRNQQGVLVVRRLDAHPSEAAGAQRWLGIGKLGGHLNGAGAGCQPGDSRK